MKYNASAIDGEVVAKFTFSIMLYCDFSDYQTTQTPESVLN